MKQTKKELKKEINELCEQLGNTNLLLLEGLFHLTRELGRAELGKMALQRLGVLLSTTAMQSTSNTELVNLSNAANEIIIRTLSEMQQIEAVSIDTHTQRL